METFVLQYQYLIKVKSTLFLIIQNLTQLKIRLTTFIKTKFKISDDQTNIDKHRLSEKIIVYHIN